MEASTYTPCVCSCCYFILVVVIVVSLVVSFSCSWHALTFFSPSLHTARVLLTVIWLFSCCSQLLLSLFLCLCRCLLSKNKMEGRMKSVCEKGYSAISLCASRIHIHWQDSEIQHNAQCKQMNLLLSFRSRNWFIYLISLLSLFYLYLIVPFMLFVSVHSVKGRSVLLASFHTMSSHSVL